MPPRSPVSRLVHSAMVTLAFLCVAEAAQAELPGQPRDEPAPSSELSSGLTLSAWPTLLTSPGWSVGIQAFSGIAVAGTTEKGYAHAVAGGLARVQIGYVHFGGFIEATDYADDEWRAIGAFAGAWFPFHRWVDVEVAAGAAQRNYRSSDTRYGSGGYDVSSPALVLRAGVSDRSTEALLGVRLGAQLWSLIDFEHTEESWRYELTREDGGPSSFLTGKTRVGGISVGLAVTAGFDVAVSSANATRRPPFSSARTTASAACPETSPAQRPRSKIARTVSTVSASSARLSVR